MVHTQYMDTIAVQFFVNCKTLFGQHVYICGNSNSLGNWSPYAGIKLETNRRNYPQWLTPHPIFLKSNELIQFKICILKDRMISWQGITQNHYFFTGNKSVQVYLSFNSICMEILQKKITQIPCRTGTDNVMEDLDSEWGSSIEHLSNYSLENFHLLKKKGQFVINRSQISSNLISVIDSEQLQFEQKIFHYLNAGSLWNTTLKLCEKKRKLSAKKYGQKTQKKINNQKEKENKDPDVGRRSYRSLPKQNKEQVNSLLYKNNSSGIKSFPRIYQKFMQQQKIKNTIKNAETVYSQKKILSEKQYQKASWISHEPQNNDQDTESEQDVDDLFGFEYF